MRVSTLPRTIVVALVVALALLLVGAVAARAGPLRVVASLPPVALIAEEVMGGRGEVVRLGDGGAGHAHGGSLRPSDVRAIDAADLVLWIDARLEPTLARALPDDGRAVALGELDEVSDRVGAQGVPDPHVWLSPDNASAMARAVATELSARDPEGAALYADNVTALLLRIAVAGETARHRLGNMGMTYAVEHDAFGHFTDWVGLPGAVAVEGRGARSLRAAAAAARRDGVACVVAEPGVPARLAAVLDGVPTVTIDPLGRDATGLPELIESVAAGFDECLPDGASPRAARLPPG